jgi:DNA-binding transcriptional LysR family regulator
MRAFVKVVEAGSFARAADLLELNGAVVTRLVADLEQHLGSRLLNRTTRSLSLTEQGGIYLESCRRILNDVDDADAQVRESSGVIKGHLRLIAASTVGLDLLAPRLIDYRRIHPRVTIELDLADRPLDMVERGYDLAVTPRFFDVPGHLVARTLFESPIILCASPEYLRESGMPLTPADLSRHSCLNFSHETVTRFWQLQSPAGTVPTSVNTVLLSNSPDVLLIAARSGLGICITGESLISSDLECSRLVRVLPDYDLGRLEIVLVYPSRKFVSAKVRSMIDFLSVAQGRDA